MDEREVVPRWPFARALLLTVVCGSVGWFTDRLAVHEGYRFPSFGYLLGEVAWKLVTLGVLVWALHRFDGRRLTMSEAGCGRGDRDGVYPWKWALAVITAGIVLSVTIGGSATDTSSFGTAHKAGLLLVMCELFIRYPLTIAAEESLFRGVLQPRLGPNGPALSAVLWALYHLQQISTIPSLAVFGVVLGWLRWRSGNVRASAAIHYLSDAAFFVAGYT